MRFSQAQPSDCRRAWSCWIKAPQARRECLQNTNYSRFKEAVPTMMRHQLLRERSRHRTSGTRYSLKRMDHKMNDGREFCQNWNWRSQLRLWIGIVSCFVIYLQPLALRLCWPDGARPWGVSNHLTTIDPPPRTGTTNYPIHPRRSL